MNRVQLTQERVRELFDYDPETGIVSQRGSRYNAGSKPERVGYLSNCGYYNIKIDGYGYRLHRVIWLWLHGYFPENDIDHRNRIRTDNRELNLRESSRSCNVLNSSLRSDNKSGVVGVSQEARGQRLWVVQISHRRVRYTVGSFHDFTEAVAHRLAAEQCFGFDIWREKTTAQKYMEAYRCK